MKKEPKISIVTIVKNGLPYINDSLKSFELQSYHNKELIVVYTKSDDLTFDVLKSKKFIKKIIIDNKSNNIYGSINIGIKHSSGDLIGFLHSDDIFYNSNTLQHIAKKYKKHNFNVGYGNILISNKYDLKKILRSWQSSSFKKSRLKYGWMPPHTSIFISKKLKNYRYSQKYTISSDYDYILRVFNKSKKIYFFNNYITIMRSGGLSNKYFFLKFKEDLKILKNYYDFNFIIAIIKIIRKINQLFILNKKVIVNNYTNNFFKRRYPFINDINKLISKKKFVLSGFNMAFLSFVHNKIEFDRDSLYLWPDGIFSKFTLNKSKIPGRKILSNIKNSKYFENVYLISSKNLNNIKYLKKKFKNKSFNFIEAPYGTSESIYKKIKKEILKIRSKSLIILGLPTPKQEEIAAKISINLRDYKIICLGGAINYNSKDTKLPPKFLEIYFESLWRLQNDTLRRSIRLSQSLGIFIKRFIFGEYKNL